MSVTPPTQAVHTARSPQPTTQQHARWASAALVGAGLLVAGLFYLGRLPAAGHLFDSPWDKLAHFIFFGGLSALLAASRPHRYRSLRWLLACALAATLVGAADELHQLFLPERAAGFDDFSADAIGALAGVLAWHLVSRLAQASSRAKPAPHPR